MNLVLLARGVVLGLAIAAPVGPMGLLCIRRTLAKGFLSGFLSGLGVATADALYGSVAAFGLAAISALLIEQQRWVRLIGGMALLYLGSRTLVARRAVVRAPDARRATALYGSALVLTLTNPATILSFAALFAGLGAVGTGGSGALSLVLGVFGGSALWWLLLASGVAAVRRSLPPAAVRRINILSGGALVGFGVWTLLSIVPG